MRILYISKYALNPKYGSPTRQFFYTKYLSRITDNEVLLISSRSTISTSIPKISGTYKTDDIDGLKNIILNGPHIRLGFNLKRLWSWLHFEIQVRRIWKKIKNWKPDVIIVSSLSLLTILNGIGLKRLLKIPLVFEVRDIYPLTIQQFGLKPIYRPAFKILSWIERKGYREADLIVSSLPNLGPHVEKVLGHEKKVSYYPMGIDFDFFQNKEVENTNLKKLETRLIEIKKTKRLIGYAGTIGVANDLEYLLDAFSSQEEGMDNFHLILIGDGPLKSSFEEKYRNAENIEFLGRFQKIELPVLLSHCTFLVNPWKKESIYEYGISPNKWIDYLYADKPIMVAYSGYKFLIDEFNLGWFIEPESKEAIIQFFNDLGKLDDEEFNNLIKAKSENIKSVLKDKLDYKILGEKMNSELRDLISADV